MAQYSYNGTVLPELPDSSYANALIMADDNGYYLHLESKPFVYYSGSGIVYLRDSEWAAYYCKSGDSEWTAADIAVEDGDSTYIAVDSTSSYVWTNADIYDTETAEIVYYGTAPEYYSTNIPTATLVCDPSTTVPVEEEGWHIQARLRLEVSELETGATREITWYVGDSVLQSGGYTVKPLCDTEGTYSYCVTVTDTGWNGVSVGCTSNTVTVTVKGYDLSNWSTDDSDIITPYENEEDSEAEVPTILSCGANAMYDKDETASALACVASVSDGGELSYEWFEDGRAAYDTAEVTPTTEEYGKKNYFCVVTNTLNGSTASAASDTITITVWSHKRFQSGIVVGLACDGWYMGETAGEETEVEPFLQGVEIGRKLKAKRLEPVAYLYNGVELPALPEWDKEAYPYATILKHYLLDDYYFICSSGSFCYETVAYPSQGFTNEGLGTYPINTAVSYQFWHIIEGQWEIHAEGEGTGWMHDFVWADYDIMRTEYTYADREYTGGMTGEVYLAASEPVPVYE